MPLPEIDGVVSRDQLARTAATIAACQGPDGAIPWYPGDKTDPWDHVEAAMGLDVAGLHREATAAYDWLASSQRPDGSWARAYHDGEVADPAVDTNFCAYVAVGVWHHWLATGDADFVARLWPTVRRALGFVLDMQAPGGQIRWARDGAGRDAEEALLSSSSSIYQALRCGLALAAHQGVDQPDWELAAGRLGHAVTTHPERFADKARWSMDWYYPVLGGAVRGGKARRRLAAGWRRFVVDGLGIRCVADEPWVTGAETCELAIALDAVGDTDGAVEVIASMGHLREDDGTYWTGYVYTDRARWPVERTSWTAAAVLLAVDAVARVTPTSGIFRGDQLPVGVAPADVICSEEIAGLRRACGLPADFGG